MSMHHKFSLLYYILLDFDDASKEVFVSESFASLSGMPANYQLFMKGLWHMDREEYSVRLREHRLGGLFSLSLLLTWWCRELLNTSRIRH